jgi:hypothetical protein
MRGMTKNILEWGWQTFSPNSSSSNAEWKPATTLLGGAEPGDLGAKADPSQNDDKIEVAQLRCQGMRGGGGCSSGGNYGTTATHGVEGRKLCVSCAVKAIGAENLPSTEQTEMLRPFLLTK